MTMMTIDSLKQDFRAIEDAFLLLKTDRDRKIEELHKKEEEKDKIISDLEICAKSIEFVEKVSTEERQGIKSRVEDLITSCLQDVFDESYSVEFDYGIKRSKTSVEVYSIRNCEDGLKVRRQIDGIGGGVADSISLPLKLIVLINDSDLERILVLDEPGKHLSINHVPKFAHFIQTISKKLGIQIIMVSHHQCMSQYADSVNEVSLSGSVSKIERVK